MEKTKINQETGYLEKAEILEKEMKARNFKFNIVPRFAMLVTGILVLVFVFTMRPAFHFLHGYILYGPLILTGALAVAVALAPKTAQVYISPVLLIASSTALTLFVSYSVSTFSGKADMLVLVQREGWFSCWCYNIIIIPVLSFLTGNLYLATTTRKFKGLSYAAIVLSSLAFAWFVVSLFHSPPRDIKFILNPSSFSGLGMIAMSFATIVFYSTIRIKKIKPFWNKTHWGIIGSFCMLSLTFSVSIISDKFKLYQAFRLPGSFGQLAVALVALSAMSGIVFMGSLYYRRWRKNACNEIFRLKAMAESLVKE